MVQNVEQQQSLRYCLHDHNYEYQEEAYYPIESSPFKGEVSLFLFYSNFFNRSHLVKTAFTACFRTALPTSGAIKKKSGFVSDSMLF